METITKEYKVYEFKELKPEIQRAVIEKWAQHELERDDWYEFELEDIANELLETYGIKAIASDLYFDIYENWFSIGRKADIVNSKKFLMNFVDNKVLLAQTIANPEWNMNNLDFDLEEEGTYGRSNYISVNCNGYNYEDGDERWEEDKSKKILEEELQINLDDCIDSINDKMLKRLKEQQDYIQSDEHIKGEIEANELKFLENGEIFN